MKKNLTELGIEKIKPPREGVIEIFDLAYPGLALRVGHGGAKSFVHFYRTSKLHRQTLGRWPAISLAQARETWRETRAAIGKGEDPRGNKASLFEHVAEEWLKRDQAQNKEGSLYQVTRSFEADVLPAWRGKRVDAITKRDVIELLDSISDRGAPAMALRVRSHVRRFFRWCIERDILKADPTAGLPRVGGNGKSRDRVLTDDELAKVLRAAEGSYGSVVHMLALTGARREEIAQLKWSEIDGDTIRLEGVRTKNGEPHTIPLSSAARALLEAMPRVGDYVFTGSKPVKCSDRLKIKLDETCGVTNWRLHDLRRTVATGMQKLGTNLQTIEAVLGHTSGSRSGVVGVYQRHSFDAEKRVALEAWGAHVTGQLHSDMACIKKI